MNKRIKKLAIHAGFAADPNGKWPTIIPIGSELEKFAELIVQECVDITNTYNVNGKSIVGQVIKEHFDCWTSNQRTLWS